MTENISGELGEVQPGAEPVLWDEVAGPGSSEKVGGPRHYAGPTLGTGPWNCPACGVENVGDLNAGCTSCGSGSKQAYKAPVTARPQPPRSPLALGGAQPEARQTARASLDTMAQAWAAHHADSTITDAFIAGYELALQISQARTMQAPPVTADLASLAPERKAQRTILAALTMFREQVLVGDPEEISTGEWCTVDEVNELIRTLEAQ